MIELWSDRWYRVLLHSDVFIRHSRHIYESFILIIQQLQSVVFLSALLLRDVFSYSFCLWCSLPLLRMRGFICLGGGRGEEWLSPIWNGLPLTQVPKCAMGQTMFYDLNHITFCLKTKMLLTVVMTCRKFDKTRSCEDPMIWPQCDVYGRVSLSVQERVWDDVAVATSFRQADRSWARRFAVASKPRGQESVRFCHDLDLDPEIYVHFV